MDRSSFLPTALPIAAATFATMLGMGMMVPALPHLTADSGGAVAAGALVSAFGVARLAVNLPAGAFADRYGIAPTAVLGLLVLVAGSLVGYGLPGFWPLAAALALQGAGAAVFSTAAMTALVLAAGPERRGAAMSWFQGALLLAMGIGPVVGGLVVDRAGAVAPFLIEAVLGVAALAAVRVLPRAAAPAAGPGTPVAVSLLSAALAAGAAMGFAAFFARVGGAWNVVPAVALHDHGLSSSHLGWIVGAATLANFAVMPFAAHATRRCESETPVR